ncbi:MAG: hypothetical protein L3J35_05520 [Bacteroidales bacterium]|nr:hypothetical protein [Bacteroidales bacterium]
MLTPMAWAVLICQCGYGDTSISDLLQFPRLFFYEFAFWELEVNLNLIKDMLTKELKSHLLNMYLIAMSDAEFDEKEMETIISIAESKGISKNEFEQIIIKPTNVPFTIPDDIIIKIEYLFDFARIIWADGKVDDRERISLLDFCNKFGFIGETANELTEWLLDIAKNDLTNDQLHKEIDKLLNS